MVTGIVVAMLASVSVEPPTTVQHAVAVQSGTSMELGGSEAQLSTFLAGIPAFDILQPMLANISVGLSAKVHNDSRRDDTRYFAYMYECREDTPDLCPPIGDERMSLAREWAERMRAPEIVHQWLSVLSRVSDLETHRPTFGVGADEQGRAKLYVEDRAVPLPVALHADGYQTLEEYLDEDPRLGQGVEIASLEWLSTDPDAGVILRLYQRCYAAAGDLNVSEWDAAKDLSPPDDQGCNAQLKQWPPGSPGADAALRLRRLGEELHPPERSNHYLKLRSQRYQPRAVPVAPAMLPDALAVNFQASALNRAGLRAYEIESTMADLMHGHGGPLHRRENLEQIVVPDLSRKRKEYPEQLAASTDDVTQLKAHDVGRFYRLSAAVRKALTLAAVAAGHIVPSTTRKRRPVAAHSSQLMRLWRSTEQP